MQKRWRRGGREEEKGRKRGRRVGKGREERSRLSYRWHLNELEKLK